MLRGRGATRAVLRKPSLSASPGRSQGPAPPAPSAPPPGGPCPTRATRRDRSSSIPPFPPPLHEYVKRVYCGRAGRVAAKPPPNAFGCGAASPLPPGVCVPPPSRPDPSASPRRRRPSPPWPVPRRAGSVCGRDGVCVCVCVSPARGGCSASPSPSPPPLPPVPLIIIILSTNKLC